MSSGRRSRDSRRGTSRMSEDQVAELLSKLQQLIPQIQRRHSTHDRGSSCTRRVLEETCNYIRSLQREVDDLSERLSELLASTDFDNNQASIIRTLLLQH